MIDIRRHKISFLNMMENEWGFFANLIVGKNWKFYPPPTFGFPIPEAKIG